MNTQREVGMATAHRVLILGAGYAGMSAAIQFAARVKWREDVQVTLVNPQERFTERLRLHMTATGQRLAEMSIPELLEGTGAQFVRGWVTTVDADATAPPCTNSPAGSPRSTQRWDTRRSGSTHLRAAGTCRCASRPG